MKKIPASVFIGLVITAIIGLVFTFAGLGAGDTLMPSVPANFITTSFDLSVFGGFVKGFGSLFSNIPT